MRRICARQQYEDGVALLMAIALLLVFSILGTAYLRYMTIEAEKARLDAGNTRARYAAAGGIHAALAQVKTALAERTVGELTQQSAAPLEMAVYEGWKDETGELKVDEGFQTQVTWTVRDECAKLNLNHAPASALRIALGVDGTKAREICAALPRSEEGIAAGPAERRWLTSVEDLVSRGLLSQQAFQSIDASSLTVYTVPDPTNPAGYINLNSAPPKVLEAALDISPDAAQAMVRARPFASAADVCQAAGKPAALFNFKPDPEMPDAMPRALALESNTFRIYSQAKISRAGGGVVSHVAIEAVAALTPDGRTVFTYWNETAGEGAGQSTSEELAARPAGTPPAAGQ